jgi:excisionase family DNA binding protein
METYLTRAEACAYLKVTERSLVRWKKSGRLPVVYLGHRLRFRRSDLDALLSPVSPRPSVFGVANPVAIAAE